MRRRRTSGLWRAIVVAAWAASSLPQRSGAIWWLQQEAVDASETAAYEEASQEFFRLVGDDLSLELFALRGEDSLYTYLAQAPEASIPSLRHLSRERARSLVLRGLKEPEIRQQWMLIELPELSHDPSLSGEEQNFYRFEFHHVSQGREASAWRLVGELAELRGSLGLGAKAFRSALDGGRTVYVVIEPARDRPDLLDRQQRAARRLGRKGRGLARALDAELIKTEVVEGEIFPALGVAGGASLAEVLWPPAAGGPVSSQEKPASGDVASRVAPLEPLPMPTDRSEPLAAVEASPEAPGGRRIVPLQPLPTAGRPASPREPVPPASETPDGAAVAVSSDIEATVRAWAAAWAGQRVDEYLRFYSSRFLPPDGTSRRIWESLRRDRLTRPSSIDIAVGSLAIRFVEPGRARVEFEQSYRSNSYRDRVVKRLEVIREAGLWRILREQVISTQRDG